MAETFDEWQDRRLQEWVDGLSLEDAIRLDALIESTTDEEWDRIQEFRRQRN